MSQHFHSVPPVGGKTICDNYEKSQIFEVYENFKFEDLNDDALDIGRCMVFPGEYILHILLKKFPAKK